LDKLGGNGKRLQNRGFVDNLMENLWKANANWGATSYVGLFAPQFTAFPQVSHRHKPQLCKREVSQEIRVIEYSGGGNGEPARCLVKP